MKNNQATETTQAAAVAEPGAHVAPEKASSKKGATQKRAGSLHFWHGWRWLAQKLNLAGHRIGAGQVQADQHLSVEFTPATFGTLS